jgi:hypothetical protein
MCNTNSSSPALTLTLLSKSAQQISVDGARSMNPAKLKQIVKIKQISVDGARSMNPAKIKADGLMVRGPQRGLTSSDTSGDGGGGL